MRVSDNSPRTFLVAKWSVVLQICIYVLIASTIALVAGILYYSHVEKNSSTPKGTSLNFPVTNSQTKLKEIYTDKNKDVLIARLSVPNSSDLPYKGTDYNISIHAKSLLKYDKTDILFGRISTDGDMYLVIPKPKDQIYSVFIENTKAVTSGGTSYASSASGSQGNSSYSKAISDYEFEGNEGAKYKTNQLDAVGFRITIDPAFNKKDYKPKVLDTDLLDGTNFRFDRFYTHAFKNKIINDLKQRHSNLDTEYKDMKKKVDYLNDQVKENPDDTSAKQSQEEQQQKLETLESKRQELANKITEQQNEEYSSDMFENINKKADIIKDTKD